MPGRALEFAAYDPGHLPLVHLQRSCSFHLRKKTGAPGAGDSQKHFIPADVGDTRGRSKELARLHRLMHSMQNIGRTGNQHF